jgi:hypothetical protein
MEEHPPSVKRGDWVLVDDVAQYEGRVAVVIGVTAVIQVSHEDGGGDTYRAAEARRCRPWLRGDAAEWPAQTRPEHGPAGRALAPAHATRRARE